jgi:hypothetical protein
VTSSSYAINSSQNSLGSIRSRPRSLSDDRQQHQQQLREGEAAAANREEEEGFETVALLGENENEIWYEILFSFFQKPSHCRSSSGWSILSFINSLCWQCCDPDPDWMRIQWDRWIRIRIQEGKKDPEK